MTPEVPNNRLLMHTDSFQQQRRSNYITEDLSSNTTHIIFYSFGDLCIYTSEYIKSVEKGLNTISRATQPGGGGAMPGAAVGCV